MGTLSANSALRQTSQLPFHVTTWLLFAYPGNIKSTCVYRVQGAGKTVFQQLTAHLRMPQEQTRESHNKKQVRVFETLEMVLLLLETVTH